MEILLQILILILPLSFYIKKLEIAYVIIIGILSIIYMKKNNKITFNLKKTPIHFYFLFLITSVITELILYMQSESLFKTSISPYMRIVIYFFIIMLILTISRKKDIFDRFLTTIIVSSFIPNLVGLYQIKYDVFTIVYSLEGQRRLGSTFDHPNFYAFYIVIVVICLLYKNKKSDKLSKKTVITSYIIINILLLIITYARTPLAALLLILGKGLAGFIFKRRRHKYMKIAILCFFTLLITFSISYFLKSSIFINSRFNIATTENSGSFTWRLGKWGSSLAYWGQSVKNILIGCGWVTARELGTNSAYTGFDMHNEFLRILFDTGAIGFTLYISYFISLIANVVKFNTELIIRKFIINLTILLVFGCLNDNILVVPETSGLLLILFCLTYANTVFWNDLSKKDVKI
ncbi:MAG: O-antigen ligase family protein [Clostridiaceae bacterium]